jgi:hypothetical protein
MMSGKFTYKLSVVKDHNGNVLSKDSDIMKRWAEHFRSVLNRGNPTQLPIIDIDNDLEELDINIDEINEEEIRKDIKQLKNTKAAGIDNIPAELLKADITATANALHDCSKTSRDQTRCHRSGKWAYYQATEKGKQNCVQQLAWYHTSTHH